MFRLVSCSDLSFSTTFLIAAQLQDLEHSGPTSSVTQSLTHWGGGGGFAKRANPKPMDEPDELLKELEGCKMAMHTHTVAGETPDSLAGQSRTLSHLKERCYSRSNVRSAAGFPTLAASWRKARDHREDTVDHGCHCRTQKVAAGDRLPLAPHNAERISNSLP